MILKNQLPYVYEFTNKRKLKKHEFIHYVQKKFLYIIRKFEMIKEGESISFVEGKDFRNVVLKNLLENYSKKAFHEIVKNNGNKIAIAETTDTIALKLIQELIKGKGKLEKFSPVQGKKIFPLYLFLDEEIWLYAKLNNLKFKDNKKEENKINNFVNDLEKKHPEIKHAIVKSFLELSNFSL